jgi:hypothetical protein
MILSISLGSRGFTEDLPYVAGEIIVKFKPEIPRKYAPGLHRNHGATVIQQMGNKIERVKLESKMSVTEAIEAYQKDPNIEFAQPNYIYYLESDKQWGWHNIGQQIGVLSAIYDADIDGPEAWNLVSGATNTVIVALIDSGVDYHHPDLSHAILKDKGWDFFDNDNDAMDDHGHGTFIAGIIAGKGTGEDGVKGVNPNVKILPLRSIGGSNLQTKPYYYGVTTTITPAIDYAITQGAKIINASFGTNDRDWLLYFAMERAKSAGVLVVAAAGNQASNNDVKPFNPASYGLSNIISVAASNYNDWFYPSSNYGPKSVDVAAPGEYIYSTWLSNSYNYGNGTSYATPYVSGIASLLLARYPALSPEQLKDFILNGVDPKPELKDKIKTGGRVNAYRTLMVAFEKMDGIILPALADSKDNSTRVPQLQVRASKETFFIRDGVEFIIESNRSGSGTLKIYGVEQNLVNLIPFSYENGLVRVRWDGKDGQGDWVFSDIYWAVIESSGFERKIIPVAAIQ